MPTRAHRFDESAVSPVISVILMVAITVVLAATVFIIASDFGGDSAPAPTVVFRNLDASDRLEVIGAHGFADWSRLDARVEAQSGATAIYMGTNEAGGYQNEAAAATGANVLSAPVKVSIDRRQILANDYLEFCADSTATQVSILIVDVEANFKLGSHTFGTIDPC